MPGRASQSEHVEAIAKVGQAAPQAAMFREHLQEIVSSRAFKGSRRSQEFLQNIVEKALNGQFESLKERVLGVELFGRPTSYDTGEDAIVRVTASDVRRRLHQYYAESSRDSDIRIELPSGSYIPEFRQVAPRPAIPPGPEPAAAGAARSTTGIRWRWLLALAGVSAAILAGWIWRPWSSTPATATGLVNPWIDLFDSGREIRVLFCDPEISLLQTLLGYRLSVSDYANRRYVPDRAAVSADMRRMSEAMRGGSVASVDAAIAVSIAGLAAKAGRIVRTQTARSLQMTDFKTDDHFILLGSPQSNPWSSLFAEELDFRFEFDPGSGREVIRNARPQSGERPRYVPTAGGWGTGEAYGILAWIGNPGQKGQVILIAGSNAEATEAAGKLATDMDRLGAALKRYGIDPRAPVNNVQFLLRVAMMAGSPYTFEVIACHKLSRKR